MEKHWKIIGLDDGDRHRATKKTASLPIES